MLNTTKKPTTAFYKWAETSILRLRRFAALDPYLRRMTDEDPFVLFDRIKANSTIPSEIKGLLYEVFARYLSRRYVDEVSGREHVAPQGDFVFEFKAELDDFIDMRQFIAFEEREATKNSSMNKNVISRFTITKPEDMVGRIVSVHGGFDSTHVEFTVPHDTYVIYTTVLGTLGIANATDRHFMEMLQDPTLVNDFLYLLTYDYNDDFLKKIKFIESRVIYTPFMKCNDSNISMTMVEPVECQDGFEEARVYTRDELKNSTWEDSTAGDTLKTVPVRRAELNRGKIHTNANSNSSSSSQTYVEFHTPKVMAPNTYEMKEIPDMGIYNLPIRYYQTSRDRPYQDNMMYKMTYALDGKYHTEFSKNPLTQRADLIARIDDIERNPYEEINIRGKDLTGLYNPILDPSVRYIMLEDHATGLKHKSRSQKILRENGTYKCGVQLQDRDKQAIGYRTVADFHDVKINITHDTQMAEMKFSNLIYELRAELDAAGKFNKKLVIITQQCRAFGVATHEEICLRVENNMIKALRKLEKFPAEKKMLADAHARLERNPNYIKYIELLKREASYAEVTQENITRGLRKIATPESRTQERPNNYFQDIGMVLKKGKHGRNVNTNVNANTDVKKDQKN